MDYRNCPMCNGIIEAGGDNFCTCNDDDGYGDWLMDCAKDREREQEMEDAEND